MGRLVGKGVPDLGSGVTQATNHKGLAAWVVKNLEP